jgi:nitroreductase
MVEGLYEAILARRSVRRYERQQLGPEELAAVAAVAGDVEPLVHDNLFHQIQVDVNGDELTHLGAYGRIVSPPHYLVPYVVTSTTPGSLGQAYALTDLGYRVEQIAVGLTRIGMGTCFIGALEREEDVRKRFQLPANARVAAFLIFGRPATGVLGRGINAAFHVATGGNRLPLSRLFFQDTFDNPTAPPPELVDLLEAGRAAPSAVNTQPWRFLWTNGRLHLFVTSQNLLASLGRSSYHLHDGGTCMANITLACRALGIGCQWRLYQGQESDIPPHPDGLQPLAVLELAAV